MSAMKERLRLSCESVQHRQVPEPNERGSNPKKIQGERFAAAGNAGRGPLPGKKGGEGKGKRGSEIFLKGKDLTLLAR